MLRKGREEYHFCWRLEDAPSSRYGIAKQLPVHDRVSLLYFLQGLISDPRQEHALRLFLSTGVSRRNISPNLNVFEQVAALVTSGQLFIARADPSQGFESEGIIRTGEGAGGGSSSSSRAASETTPRQVEAARKSEAVQEEEEIVLGEEEPEKTWIEIELFDKNGQPVPNERYKITLPDGSVKWGRLDHSARARIEKLQQGACQVTFPDRDEKVWEVE